MKLYVQVVEAKDLCSRDPNGFSDPFVRLSLGSTKARTSVVHKNLYPSWNEDFFFNVTDLDDELKVTVWDEDRFTDDFLGQVKIPVADVLDSDKQSISRSWFRLQKRSEKSKTPITGEILLDVTLFGRTFSSEDDRQPQARVSTSKVAPSPSRSSVDDQEEHILSSTDSGGLSEDTSDLAFLELESEQPLLSAESSARGTVLNEEAPFVKEFLEVEKKKKDHGHAFAYKISSLFQKKGKKNSTMSPSNSSRASEYSTDTGTGFATEGSVGTEPSLLSTCFSESGEDDEEVVPLSFFQDDEKSVGQSPEDLPTPLSGGVLVDQSFAVSMKAMNAILFKPETRFTLDLAEVQKTSELELGAWKKVGNEPMKRTVTYRKAPTRLLKSVVASEVQTYVRADDKGFAILCQVSTPDVPYGKNFLTELLFVITPGPALPTGERTCRLQISWRINFLQNTMMRGMIVNGAGQGLKESYIEHQQVLAKYAKPVSAIEGMSQENAIAEVPMGRPKTDWELAREYFGNYTVLLTVLGVFFVMLHIILVKTKCNGGLELWYIDLPDSFWELFTVAVLTRQVERVGKMVQKFFTARMKAGDHGVKAQGAGWLLTVTLVEAQDLYSIDADGSCDPYVVFTCNGKIRTSSVILGSFNPEWKEVYEFDATEDPPSTLDIEVFDYDGPFAEAESLGHTAINFLKSKSNDYADVWLPLIGQHAQSHGSKLHLRVILTNTKDWDVRPEYINKVEKEAGTKIVRRSPQRNKEFQKLFALPQEEFLINDYACAIKRKIPIQGRLFLSPRMLGFYSNLFGHKTKFGFVWEDIEEIKEAAPSRGALFNPSITITLRKGRAQDCRQGSKGVDHHGRLRFQFLSFVRPSPAFRTIIALWKNRTLSVEQTMELVASVEAGEMKYSVAERQADDTQPFLGLEEAHMSQLADRDFPATVQQVSQLIEYGALDHQVMEMFCVNNYRSTQWETVGDDPCVKRRQVSYVMSRTQCRFGSSVTSIQQKTLSNGSRSGVFEELMTLHDVPFGDHFLVQVRKEASTITENPPLGHVKVYAGVAWHKNAGFQKKITKNILQYMSQFLKEYVEFATKIIVATPPEAFHVVEPAKESSVRMLPSILTKLMNHTNT
ncbi:unnamed protein product [Calypogeia fissa]